MAEAEFEWQKVYLAALTELDDANLVFKIDQAEKAIRLRLEQQLGADELEALQDALNGLRALSHLQIWGYLKKKPQ